MKRMIGVLFISVFLLAFIGTASPTAAHAEDIVIHVPLRLTKIQAELANTLYLDLEVYNATQSFPLLFSRREKIPIQNGQYIGTITFKMNYGPTLAQTGLAKYYRVTVTNGTTIVNGVSGLATTMIQPIPANN